MAKFCTQCGTPLHPEFGFCPSCEKDIIQKMGGVPNFCTICGGKVDKQTGICPGCGHSFAVIHTSPASPAEPEKPAQMEKPAEPKKTEEVAVKPAPAPKPPVVQQPQKPAAQPVKAPKPVKRKKKRAGSVAITITLCFLLFLFTFSGTILYSARSMATDEEKIETLMDTVTVSEFLDLMGEEYKEAFYDALRDFIKEKTGATLTPRKLDELAERSTIKGEISKQLVLYVTDIVEDENNFNLKQRNIEDILKKNRSAVEKVLEADVSDEVLEKIAKWLVDDSVMDAISPRAIKKSAPAVYYSVHIGLSWLGILVFVLLIGLCIFLLCCNSLSHAAVGGGLVFTVVGGLATALSVVAMLLPNLMVGIFENHLIGSAVNVFFSTNILLYVAILLLGIAAIVTQILVSKAAKKRNAI